MPRDTSANKSAVSRSPKVVGVVDALPRRCAERRQSRRQSLNVAAAVHRIHWVTCMTDSGSPGRRYVSFFQEFWRQPNRAIILALNRSHSRLVLPMSDVTRILSAIEQGDPQAAEQLLPLIYDELRKLAAQKLAREKPGQTLQATALVHEVYARLVDVDTPQQWNGRGHFFAAAAEAMRRILIEQARHKASAKAGGNLRRVELSDVDLVHQQPQFDLLVLNDALEQFEKTDPRAAAIVKLRFFVGLTMPQVAEALGISLATAENDWTYAKCCLRLQLSNTTGGVASY